MKLMTLFVLALSIATAQTSDEVTIKIDEPQIATSTSGWLYTAPQYVEIGGLDQNGKPYLMVKGKRKPCSMRTLIKAVKASKMDDRTKATALQYLGHPVNATIHGPERKP